MSVRAMRPVLLVGGSGLVGRATAKVLRAAHPNLPLAIGGRDVAKARAVADELGNAEAVRVDLATEGLGLADGFVPSAVVPFVKDEWMHGLRFAQKHRAAYASISSATFELAPEIAQFVQDRDASAVVLLSYWLAGVATLPVLAYAKAFARVDRVAIGAVLDDRDVGGPAAYADLERFAASPRVLGLSDGHFAFVADADAKRSFVSVDGAVVEGTQYAPLDVVSLAGRLGAPNVRLDLVVGESAGRRKGGPFSSEIVLELAGTDHAGAPLERRHTIAHPEGQAPLTAFAVATIVARLLGLDGGEPVAPGLYGPESLLEPTSFVERLRAFGAEVA